MDCIIQLLNNWGLSHAALGRNVAFCKTPLAAANSPHYSASEQSTGYQSHCVISGNWGKESGKVGVTEGSESQDCDEE